MKNKILNTLLPMRWFQPLFIFGFLMCNLAHGNPIQPNSNGTVGINETKPYKNAKEVVLSGKTTNIGPGAFKNFSNLESVTIDGDTGNAPEMSIQPAAFSKCENLKQVNLLYIKTIGIKAFDGCSKLTFANFQRATEIHRNAFSGCPIEKICLLKGCKVDSTAFGTPINFGEGRKIDATQYEDTDYHMDDSKRSDGEVIVEWKNTANQTILIEAFEKQKN